MTAPSTSSTQAEQVPATGSTALSGGLAVTSGLLVLGLSSYAFLAIASHTTTPAQFSAVAAAWSLIYALTGVFTPLEQETTRAVAERRARAERIAPVATRVAVIGAVAGLVTAAGLLLLRGPLAGRVLGGYTELVPALVVTLLATGASFVLRGVFAGSSRYRMYGSVLAGEGLLRVAGTALLAAAIGSTAGRLGLVLAVAAVTPQVLALAALPRAGGRHRAGSWSEVTANLGWLMGASIVSQFVANAGPVVLQLLGPADPGLAGRFLAAFVLVRIPLFFVSALQASLLPRLVRAVELADHQGYTRALLQMLGIVGVLGALALAAFAVIGPAFVSLLVGGHESVGRSDLVVLGLSSVLFVLASLLQSAALALGGHRLVAAAWGVGGIVFVATCLVPLQPLLRLEIAYTLSSMIVPLILGAWLAVARSGAGARSAEPMATSGS